MPAENSSAIEKVEEGVVAAKATMAGALRSTKTETLAAISHAAEIAIQNTARAGGDLGHVATGLVQGAIQCAKELGVSIEDAAASAADGALKGAHRVRSAASDIVRSAVSQTIDGVTVRLRRAIVVSPLHPNTSSPPLVSLG